MQEPVNLSVPENNPKMDWYFVGALVFLALGLRLMVAYTSVHYYDLNYYVDWSAGAAQDLFGAYENVGNLDYPPLFLFPLVLTGKLMAAGAEEFHPYAMLVLKGWQMLFDLAAIPLFYWVLRGRGRLLALGCAALWAVNPAMIFNAAYWGQTDSIMIFLLVAAFGLLYADRPVWAGVVMTLACLMKFQSLYFAPVFGLALLLHFPAKKILATIGAGAATAGVVFLPFILRSGWTLPFRIYFGGFERYPAASLGAFNLYGALGLNLSHVGTPLSGGLTVSGLSALLLLSALAGLALFQFRAREQSVWLLGFFFMQTIFLFTARMHERYQIPAVAFALLAAAWHRSRGLFAGYLALTGVSLLNQFLVFEHTVARGNLQAWMLHFDRLVLVCSWLNLAIYFGTLWVVVTIARRGCAPALRGMHLPGVWRARGLPRRG